MPTFCNLADYAPKSDLKWDGTDLTPLFLRQSPLPERPIYVAGPHWQARSLRIGDWKLVVTGEDSKQKIELFQISTDRSEISNLAPREPERVTTMLKRLEQIAAADRDSVVQF